MTAVLASPRMRSALLLGSLALNVFLCGILFARLVLERPHGSEMGRHLVERLAAGLEAPDRDILGRAFEAHRAELRAAGAAIGKARQDVRAALAQEPFDPDRLRAGIAAVEAESLALHRAIRQSLIEAAIAMSPDGRHRLTEIRRLPE